MDGAGPGTKGCGDKTLAKADKKKVGVGSSSREPKDLQDHGLWTYLYRVEGGGVEGGRTGGTSSSLPTNPAGPGAGDAEFASVSRDKQHSYFSKNGYCSS